MTQNNGVVFMFNVYVSFVKFKYKAKYLRERHARHIINRDRERVRARAGKNHRNMYLFSIILTHTFTHFHTLFTQMKSQNVLLLL